MQKFSIVFTCVAGLALAGCAVAPLSAINTPRAASSFLAENDYQVVPGPGAGEFTVLGRAGASTSDFFCAAGDYAYTRLGSSPAARVVLTESVGPDPAHNGRRTGTFRVVARDQAPPRQGLLVASRQSGENLQIGHARLLCTDRRIGVFD